MFTATAEGELSDLVRTQLELLAQLLVNAGVSHAQTDGYLYLGNSLAEAEFYNWSVSIDGAGHRELIARDLDGAREVRDFDALRHVAVEQLWNGAFEDLQAILGPQHGTLVLRLELDALIGNVTLYVDEETYRLDDERQNYSGPLEELEWAGSDADARVAAALGNLREQGVQRLVANAHMIDAINQPNFTAAVTVDGSESDIRSDVARDLLCSLPEAAFGPFCWSHSERAGGTVRIAVDVDDGRCSVSFCPCRRATTPRAVLSAKLAAPELTPAPPAESPAP